VSLTTIPSRLDKIVPTLCSVLSQTHQVDEIRLNLPYKTLKGKTYKIPKYFNKLNHIKIYRVDKDLGPSTKLLPTAKAEYPDTKIIVIDDDMIYGSKLVYNLVKTFKNRGENEVVANYGSNLHVGLRRCLWGYFKGDRYIYLLYGCGGYILTPSMLPREIYDYSNAPKGAEYVDDNWISGWLDYNKVNIYLMGLRQGCLFVPSWSTANTVSLCGGVNNNHDYGGKLERWFKNKNDQK
jgi:hypothetical protein